MFSFLRSLWSNGAVAAPAAPMAQAGVQAPMSPSLSEALSNLDAQPSGTGRWGRVWSLKEFLANERAQAVWDFITLYAAYRAGSYMSSKLERWTGREASGYWGGWFKHLGQASWAAMKTPFNPFRDARNFLFSPAKTFHTGTDLSEFAKHAMYVIWTPTSWALHKLMPQAMMHTAFQSIMNQGPGRLIGTNFIRPFMEKSVSQVSRWRLLVPEALSKEDHTLWHGLYHVGNLFGRAGFWGAEKVVDFFSYGAQGTQSAINNSMGYFTSDASYWSKAGWLIPSMLKSVCVGVATTAYDFWGYISCQSHILQTFQSYLGRQSYRTGTAIHETLDPVGMSQNAYNKIITVTGDNMQHAFDFSSRAVACFKDRPTTYCLSQGYAATQPIRESAISWLNYGTQMACDALTYTAKSSASLAKTGVSVVAQSLWDAAVDVSDTYTNGWVRPSMILAGSIAATTGLTVGAIKGCQWLWPRYNVNLFAHLGWGNAAAPAPAARP